VLKGWRSTALACAVLWVAGAHTAWAGISTWTSLGPEGARVGALAIDPITPTTLYAGTSDGVFKSTNSGGTWNSIGPTNAIVIALAIDPTASSTLYAGTETPEAVDSHTLVYVGTVFKSTDAGGTWIATSLTPFVVHAFAIDPAMPTTLYAGTFGAGVFKSTDAGASWGRVNNGLPLFPFVAALAIDPTTPTTLYAGTYTNTGGVYKSTDGGGMWSPANTGLTSPDRPEVAISALAIDPTTPPLLFAGAVACGEPGGCAGGVFKSTDDGASWGPVDTGLTSSPLVAALAIDPITPTTLYAGTYTTTGAVGGVYKSTDGGGAWGAMNAGLTTTNVWALAIDPRSPSTLYAGTDGGGVFSIQQVPSATSSTGGCTLGDADSTSSRSLFPLSLLAVILLVRAFERRSRICRELPPFRGHDGNLQFSGKAACLKPRQRVVDTRSVRARHPKHPASVRTP
jgi:hypothetical protein